MSEGSKLIVDLHTHVLPPDDELCKVAPDSDSDLALERLLEHRLRNKIDISCLSYTMAYAQMTNQTGQETLTAVKKWHEYASGVGTEYPGIKFFASTIPQGGDAYLAELEHTFADPNCVGALVTSSFADLYPDEEADAFWEFVAERGITVFMHPPWCMPGSERLEMYRFISSLGRPMDVLVSVSRMIVSGILERHPSVRLVASHLGGGICNYVSRLNYAYNLRDELAGLGDYGDVRIAKEPGDYLKENVWLDTSALPTPAINCAVETVGHTHITFGSDTPPMVALGSMPLDVVEAAALTAEQKAAIFVGNALELLAIEPVGASV